MEKHIEDRLEDAIENCFLHQYHYKQRQFGKIAVRQVENPNQGTA